jgi:hypothetical protein
MSEEKNENLENNQKVDVEDKTKTNNEDNQDKTESLDETNPEMLDKIDYNGDDELKEQLSIIKEVREELAKSYKKSKENDNMIEQLSKEIEKLKKEKNDNLKTIEKLSSTLDVYKTREEEASNAAYVKRLEQLSNDFKELGQEKTVEQLSKLPKNVISEFEIITSTALKHKTEEQLDSVTVPSQSMGEKSTINVVKKSEPKKVDFSFKGLCNTLTTKQADYGYKKHINI